MVYSLLKWLLLAFLIYFLLAFILLPLRVIRHFKKYKQVRINTFIPVLGDLLRVLRAYKSRGLSPGQYFRDIVEENPQDKYVLFMSGSAPQLWVNDPAMFDEIQRMVPSKID